METKSPYKTPIFPLQKPNSDTWHQVHDLKAVTTVVLPKKPAVPDLHTLLSNIPSDTTSITPLLTCAPHSLVYHCMRTQGTCLPLPLKVKYAYTHMPLIVKVRECVGEYW